MGMQQNLPYFSTCGEKTSLTTARLTAFDSASESLAQEGRHQLEPGGQCTGNPHEIRARLDPRASLNGHGFPDR